MGRTGRPSAASSAVGPGSRSGSDFLTPWTRISIRSPLLRKRIVRSLRFTIGLDQNGVRLPSTLIGARRTGLRIVSILISKRITSWIPAPPDQSATRNPRRTFIVFLVGAKARRPSAEQSQQSLPGKLILKRGRNPFWRRERRSM